MGLPFALRSVLPHVRPAPSVMPYNTSCPTWHFARNFNCHACLQASGRFGYWRGNVHNMNYSHMRRSHAHRQVYFSVRGRSECQLPVPTFVINPIVYSRNKRLQKLKGGCSSVVLKVSASYIQLMYINGTPE